MRAEFRGGASVSRVYASDDSAELIGVFSYKHDAEAFAKAKIAEDREQNALSRSWYIVTDSYEGRVQIFRQQPLDAVKAA